MRRGIYHICVSFCLFVSSILLACSAFGAPQQLYYADQPHFISEQWTTNNGLPINHINQVYQTPDGYIWLATFNGLIRFDGVTFKEFNSGNTPSLRSNRITAIQPYKENSFWLNTEQYHFVLYQDGTFTPFEELLPPELHYHAAPFQIISKTYGDHTWIATNKGLLLYKDEQFTSVSPEIFENKKITGIYIKPDNNTLVFEKSGYLYEINSDGNVTSALKTPGISGAIASTAENNGTIWIGRNEIASVRSNEYRQIEVPVNFKADWDGEHPYFLSFKKTPDGSVLVMSLNGLMKIEGASLIPVDFIEYQNYGSFAETLGNSFTTCPDGSVWAIVKDRIYKNGVFRFRADSPGKTIYCDLEQNLWITTFRDGLYRYRESLFENITFTHSDNNFYGIFRDSYETTWIGGFFSDLTQIDQSGTVHDVVDRKNEGTTSTFLEASDGSLWNGYHRCGPEKRTESGGCFDFESSKDLYGKNIFTVFEDSEKRIWFGTNEGLFHKQNKIVTEVDLPIQRTVRYIIESVDSTLWMATNGGGLLHYKNGQFDHYSQDRGISSNNIRALYEDESGHIWIATEDMGLNRLNPETDEIVSIQKKDGLFENGLHKMLPDDFGRMWISTNHGIFWVNIEQLQQFANGQIDRITSVAYNERDGMLNREANGGFQNSGFKSDDGKLYFTTQRGVVVIDPARIDLQHSVLPVLLEDLVISGQSFLNSNSVSKLDRDQRSFSIQFTLPFFTAPDRIHFRYMLEGFDDDWNEAGSRREAIYTNVPAGSYQFKVKAYLENLESESVETIHAIVVSPYFYETTWFIIINIFLLILLLAGGYQLRLRHLIRKEKRLEKLINKRTKDLRSEKRKTEEQAEQLRILSREKDRLFANISHEFRTPLTLTIGPLKDLQEGQYGTLSPGAYRQVDLSLRNAQRLLRLVGQLMDLARLEAGKFELNLQTGNLGSYLQTVAEPFKSAADQKEIHFNIFIPGEPLFVKFDPGHFDKIIANLLSNAFKFTQPCGSVTFKLEKKGNNAVITVEDTGSGISEEHLPRLFDRFYQIQKSEMQPGTGIGLSLAKELTDLHGGSMEVKSKHGQGSTFTIQIALIVQPELPEPSPEKTKPIIASESELQHQPSPFISDGESIEEDVDAFQKTILVVDDHEEIRRYLHKHLKDEYIVSVAASGIEAMNCVKSRLPDLIISDVMMPDGDGFELLKQIRENPETNFIPVILLTARAEAEDKLSGLGFGANDYITKPFNMREMKVRIRNLFSQQKRLKHHLLNGKTKAVNEQIHHDPVNKKSTDEIFLDSVKHEIQLNLADENFTVEELALKLKQSRSNLHRRLTKLTGETPSAMIRRIRLELGAQLLQQKAGTVSEVAYSTGFKSIAHFSRVFRDHFKLSPTEYIDSKS